MAQMEARLATLAEHDAFGFHFDSHARFLFASSEANRTDSLGEYLVEIGIPKNRLIRHGSTNT